MSFDLTVSYRALPEGLKSAWEQALSRHGFVVEIFPTFDPQSWRGGFLPMRVQSAPTSLIGLELPSEAVSGCEVSFAPREANFRFGFGGPTTEFAVLCFAAATLAELTGGSVSDPQAGLTYDAPIAIDAAKKEVLANLRSARPRELVHHEFPGWQALTAG